MFFCWSFTIGIYRQFRINQTTWFRWVGEEEVLNWLEMKSIFPSASCSAHSLFILGVVQGWIWTKPIKVQGYVIPWLELTVNNPVLKCAHFVRWLMINTWTIISPRLANLRVRLLREIGNRVIFSSMLTHMKLVKMGQKSQAFLTQMVQVWELAKHDKLTS